MCDSLAQMGEGKKSEGDVGDGQGEWRECLGGRAAKLDRITLHSPLKFSWSVKKNGRRPAVCFCPAQSILKVQKLEFFLYFTPLY